MIGQSVTDTDSTSAATAAPSWHFSELRGHAVSGSEAPGRSADSLQAMLDTPGSMAPYWRHFFASQTRTAASLDERLQALQRHIRDNDVGYNVHSGDGQVQRPWSLDLFPLLLPTADWQQIERGVLQRTRLLDRVMADVYGPQQLLHEGLLPAALVLGHPDYIPGMQGVQPASGVHVHVAAFDLSRDANGHWWVVSQRLQAPSGLGYMLENRHVVAQQFPQALDRMRVQRLPTLYRALIASLRRRSPAGERAHIALLTPGPFNETYFEQAYLARYLGISLVEGSDLTVRDRKLYLKTLHGLEQVDVLIKRVDDQYLDPLELRPESRLGIPGLLQAIRAGNVIMSNLPGTGFLESSAILGFLPALGPRLLGEELLLPALHTWWCGEQAVLSEALAQMDDCVIKATYPAAHPGGVPRRKAFDPVLSRHLTPRSASNGCSAFWRRARTTPSSAICRRPACRSGAPTVPARAVSSVSGRPCCACSAWPMRRANGAWCRAAWCGWWAIPAVCRRCAPAVPVPMSGCRRQTVPPRPAIRPVRCSRPAAARACRHRCGAGW